MGILDLKPHIGLQPVWNNNPLSIPPPVGAWIMNEGSGDTAFDLSLNGNAGTLIGDLWVPDGIKADADGEYISIPDSLVLQPTTLTVVVGINPQSIALTDGVISKDPSSGIGGFKIYGATASSYYWTINAWNVTRVEFPVTVGVFQEVVCTYDLSDLVAYVNGNPVATTPENSTITYTGDDVEIHRFASGNGQTDRSIISHVYIYNQALSPAQIAFISSNPYYAWDYLLDITAILAAQGGPTPPVETLLEIFHFGTEDEITDHSLVVGSGVDDPTELGVATNGQIPIGSTGADPVLAALTGTSNQVVVTNGAGSSILSTPQDIHTGASPTFVTATLSGLTADTITQVDGSKVLASIPDGSANEVLSTNGSGAYSFKTGKELGRILANTATYVSATGTAGTANTAETVITRALSANILTQVGDRLRVRTWFFANAGAGIVGTTKVGPAGSEVIVGDVTHTGGASFNLVETWLHYIDNTHANIIEQESGGTIGNISAINVAGFTWDASQNIIFTQDAVAGNFLTVFGIFVDSFPKGV